MTLRLSEKLNAELDALATQQGVSKHQLILTAIEDFLHREDHEARFTKAFERTMNRHAGLVDRLSRT